MTPARTASLGPTADRVRGCSTGSRTSWAAISRMRWVEVATRVDNEAVEAVAELFQRFAHGGGERLVIRPSWREFEGGPGDLVVTLDPGMAFGTGLHPTTRLCLVALERLVSPGDRVLDVGTGSGILAVAAARLGAASVLA